VPTDSVSVPQRSTTLFAIAVIAFAVALAANLIGAAFFPAAAPVEEISNFLITIDLVAGLVVAIVGLVIARVNARAGAPRPLDRFSAQSIAGVALVGIALAGWIAISGMGLLLRIPTGDRGRYMYDIAGIVYFGAPWILGVAFSLFGYRRNGTRLNTVLSLIGVSVGLALLLSPAISAVLYGLGLTD
jgi:hypothetical protein